MSLKAAGRVLTPYHIYIIFLLLLILFSVIGIPLLSIGYYGGEQRPLTLLSHVFNIGFYGFFILAVFTSVRYFEWFKKYWYINLFIMGFTGYVIVRVLINKLTSTSFIVIKKKSRIGNNELTTISDYYSESRKLRIRRKFINGRKDSIWTTYSDDGKIISSEEFRNDTLIRKIK